VDCCFENHAESAVRFPLREDISGEYLFYSLLGDSLKEAVRYH
jgi:hypothetical protein